MGSVCDSPTCSVASVGKTHKLTKWKPGSLTMQFRNAAIALAYVSSVTLGGCALPHHALEAALTPTEYHMMDVRYAVDGRTVSVTGVWRCERISELRADVGSSVSWKRSRHEAIADAGKGHALVVYLPSCGLDDMKLAQFSPVSVKLVPISDGLSCYEEYYPRISEQSRLSRVRYLSTEHKRISEKDYERIAAEQDNASFNRDVEHRFVRHPSPGANRYVQYETLSAFALPEAVWKRNTKLAGLLKDPRWLSSDTGGKVSEVELDRLMGSRIAGVLEDIAYEHHLHASPFLMKKGEWVLSENHVGLRVYCPIDGRGMLWKIRYADRVFEKKYYVPFMVYEPHNKTIVVIDSRIFNKRPFLE